MTVLLCLYGIVLRVLGVTHLTKIKLLCWGVMMVLQYLLVFADLWPARFQVKTGNVAIYHGLSWMLQYDVLSILYFNCFEDLCRSLLKLSRYWISWISCLATNQSRPALQGNQSGLISNAFSLPYICAIICFEHCFYVFIWVINSQRWSWKFHLYFPLVSTDTDIIWVNYEDTFKLILKL